MSTLPRTAHRSIVALATLALTAVGVVGAAPSVGGAEAGTSTVARSSDDHIDFVLLVSVDGLNPDAIRRLGRGGAPNFHRLMDEGAATLNARTAVESTSTLPNHTGMLTSRWVDERHGGHGVSFNDDDARTTVHRAAGGYVGSIFDVAHDRGRSTALYTSKDKFALFKRSWHGRHGAVDRVGPDNGRSKIDRYLFRADEDALVDSVRRDLVGKPATLTFLHLSKTDKVGHARGYMSAAYLRQIQAVDVHVGRLLRFIESTPLLRRHLAVVLTSDHGGLGKSHSDARKPVNYTVPLMVWGRGLGAGADLYAMNPAYADPGTTRPGYGADRQPIRNAAVGNLAADLLDLPAIPGSRINGKQDLRVLSD